MYNRYIRNDNGTYTRIPQDEPSGPQERPSPSAPVRRTAAPV